MGSTFILENPEFCILELKLYLVKQHRKQQMSLPHPLLAPSSPKLSNHRRKEWGGQITTWRKAIRDGEHLSLNFQYTTTALFLHWSFISAAVITYNTNWYGTLASCPQDGSFSSSLCTLLASRVFLLQSFLRGVRSQVAKQDYTTTISCKAHFYQDTLFPQTNSGFGRHGVGKQCVTTLFWQGKAQPWPVWLSGWALSQAPGGQDLSPTNQVTHPSCVLKPQ